MNWKRLLRWVSCSKIKKITTSIMQITTKDNHFTIFHISCCIYHTSYGMWHKPISSSICLITLCFIEDKKSYFQIPTMGLDHVTCPNDLTIWLCIYLLLRDAICYFFQVLLLHVSKFCLYQNPRWDCLDLCQLLLFSEYVVLQI